MLRSCTSNVLRTGLAVVGAGVLRPQTRVAAMLCVGCLVLPTAAWLQSAAPTERRLKRNFQYALAMRGCTQEDAPALEIFLTETPLAETGDPSPPYIRIEVSSSPNEAIKPIALTLIQMRRDVSRPGRLVRAELVEVGRDSVWLSGTITLSEVVPGRVVSGRYDLLTPAGKVSNRFSAKYLNRTAVCG